MNIRPIKQILTPINSETIIDKIGFNDSTKKITTIAGLSITQYAKLKPQEQAKLYDRFYYKLTGYTKDKEPKISIWGKILGYDKRFTATEIKDLKDFIDNSKVLGTDFKIIPIDKATLDKHGNIVSLPYTVDEFIQTFKLKSTANLLTNETSLDIFDQDLNIDEFKAQWAKYALKKRFNITLKDNDAKNAIEILNQLNQSQKEIPNSKPQSKTKQIQTNPSPKQKHNIQRHCYKRD